MNYAVEADAWAYAYDVTQENLRSEAAEQKRLLILRVCDVKTQITGLMAGLTYVKTDGASIARNRMEEAWRSLDYAGIALGSS